VDSKTDRKRKRKEHREQARLVPIRIAGRLRRLLSPWLLVPTAIAAIAIVVVLGIVLQSSGSTSKSGGNWTVRVPNMDVPDFGVQATSWSGGEQFVLSQNLDKPTVLYFVAAWCSTCIPEAQALARVYGELGDKVNILIFDGDTSEKEDSLRRFKEAADGGDHLWVMDKGALISQAYDVRSLDTTIIIDGQGKQAYRDSVPTGYKTLKTELTALLPGPLNVAPASQ
jgi:peroxiredoxin